MIVNMLSHSYYIQKILSSITHCEEAIISEEGMQENN